MSAMTHVVHCGTDRPCTRAELRALAARGARRVGDVGAGAGPEAYEQRLATAKAALVWAAETFGERFTVASSMGDTELVHLVGNTVPGAEVAFIDTGYHFAETLGTRDAYSAMLPIQVRTLLPLRTVAQQDAEHGPRLYERDPDLCCAMRKVEPLERALRDRSAWATGLRRDESATRADVVVIGFDERRGLVKVNPFASWTAEDTARYARENDVFQNPLKQVGYASIGCAPCTRAVAPGEDARAGRWSGSSKTECGLHA